MTSLPSIYIFPLHCGSLQLQPVPVSDLYYRIQFLSKGWLNGKVVVADGPRFLLSNFNLKAYLFVKAFYRGFLSCELGTYVVEKKMRLVRSEPVSVHAVWLVLRHKQYAHTHLSSELKLTSK